MHARQEYQDLVELITWIDENTAGVTLPSDERTMLAVGCFDVTIEHQAAIALLVNASLHGAAFALLRVLTESLVRGLWLLHCATEAEFAAFKRGKLDKSFAQLIAEFEDKIDTPNGVLSNFKATAWGPLNGFTHTGFHQVSRRHAPGRVEGTYPAHEVAKALGVAGAVGLIAAGQIIGLSDRQERLPSYIERMTKYAQNAPELKS